MLRPSIPLRFTIAWLALMLVAGACSQSTEPERAADSDDPGRIGTEGTFNPAEQSFVLKTIDLPAPWDGPPLQIQLIGSNLEVSATDETVSLDVAIRNLNGQPLYAPGLVWVEGFVPPEISILNPDITLVPPAVSPVDSFAHWMSYGFDYSELLGGDGVLEHEEVSAPKTWIFHDPGLVSFSFQGWAEFSPQPDRSRIAGTCFVDLNLNGQRDPNEPPLQGALVTALLPDGTLARTTPDLNGHYSLPVDEAGLYELECSIIFGMPPMPPWTTPNPLEVLLTPGPDGEPNSFLEAHFGMAGDYPPPEPTIQFTDLPPDSLHHAPWSYINGFVERDHLFLHVGYSGCQPEHPFSLWMSGGFMESEPVRAKVVLVHELEEDCDAWFETELVFNLAPLREQYLAAYGQGELILSLPSLDGQHHELLWDVYYWDGTTNP